MNRALIFILIVSLLPASFGKNISPEKEKTYTVYINYPEYSVRASVLREAGKINAKPACTYYWYSNNDIKKTDGGFDGKLLHGEYKSFYRDMSLKEYGQFRFGLKDGDWVSWFSNGKIHERLHYRKGLQNGYYERYEESGKLVQKSDYKNGFLHGKTSIHGMDDKDTTINYRNGKPKIDKHPKQTGKDSADKKIRTKSERQKDTIADKPKSSQIIKKDHVLKKKNAQQDSLPRTPEKKEKKQTAKKSG